MEEGSAFEGGVCFCRGSVFGGRGVCLWRRSLPLEGGCLLLKGGGLPLERGLCMKGVCIDGQTPPPLPYFRDMVSRWSVRILLEYILVFLCKLSGKPFWPFYLQTRMHSSRMHTDRLLTILSSAAAGGVHPGVAHSLHPLPCEQNDTPVQTLPSPLCCAMRSVMTMYENTTDLQLSN